MEVGAVKGGPECNRMFPFKRESEGDLSTHTEEVV